MGRRVPHENDNITLREPFLYFPFCMVGFVTSIAIIAALCGVRFRKKSSSAPAPVSDHDSDEVTNVLNIESTTPPRTTSLEHEQHPSTSEGPMLENTAQTTQTQNNDTLVKELPLPPALQQHPSVDPKILKRANSECRLSFNLSMKMPRSFSVARNWDQKGNFNDGGRKGKLLKTDESLWMKTKEKLKNDDSVWMKTIILGGKCVPDEEDDVVIYEGKGKKISAYHPRKSTSMSLSRQCSYINPGAFSVPQSHEERIKSINSICEDKKMKL